MDTRSGGAVLGGRLDERGDPVRLELPGAGRAPDAGMSEYAQATIWS